MLDGETDVGYFDSFSSPEDMAKYAEVFKKQRDVEAVEEKGSGDRNNWVGFTFGKNHGVSRTLLDRQQMKRMLMSGQLAPPKFGTIKAEGEALQTMF